MKVSRRDLLVWSAGAAAGLIAVTPVPWKLLDDYLHLESKLALDSATGARSNRS